MRLRLDENLTAKEIAKRLNRCEPLIGLVLKNNPRKRSPMTADQRREAARQRYRLNSEPFKKKQRDRWRNDPLAKAKDKAQRDKRREKIRAYDRMRVQRDREKKKVIIARWIRNNPERHRELSRAKSHRRRARLLLAGGSFSANEIVALFSGQKGRCWWCNKRLRRYHADHRIPLSKGGDNSIRNIVLSCPSCNHKKSAKMPWQFAGRLL